MLFFLSIKAFLFFFLILKDSKQIRYHKITFYSVLFLIASVGNTTSFITLLFMRKNTSIQQKNVHYMRVRKLFIDLFLNLCVADLLVKKTYVNTVKYSLYIPTNKLGNKNKLSQKNLNLSKLFTLKFW